MTSVEQILNQMPGVNKPQRKFMTALISAFSQFVGKANMTNLHRYGAYSPRTQRRWQMRQFDFADFNRRLLDDNEMLSGPLAVAIDATFVPKSGKKTFGLANFWDSSQDRAHKGLELSLLALVSLGEQPKAWPLHASQTPAQMAFPDNRTFHYIKHLRSQRHRLPESVRYVLADSYYANLGFMCAVLDLGLHLVSKLRKDADLRYLYAGPYSGRGCPKKYDGKVDFKDWSRWEALELDDEGQEGYTLVVNHKGFGQNMRVTVIFPKGQPGKRRVLMCTDTDVTGEQVVSWYKARFQIEFVIRDGKQHTGLCDGQMRSKVGLDFHFNASLAALNALYVEEQARTDDGVFSLASVKRRNYNQTLIDLLFSQLDLDPTCQKLQLVLDELRN